MTLEQPLDQRLFDSKYDDVEILGKLVTRSLSCACRARYSRIRR